MKLTPKNKKLLIVAGVAVVGFLVYRSYKAATSRTVIGNKTLVSPESTITIGPATVTRKSQTWDKSFVDSLESLLPS